MSFCWCLLYLFLTLGSLNIVRTVPPEYCLAPLNRSDCNKAPKTVFSYYKPGSRCELETWRGCPTANKFDNEYLCYLSCIFRKPEFDQCNIPLNQSLCGEQKIVFTSVNGDCENAYWGGCPTRNMFESGSDCQAACGGRVLIFEIYPPGYEHETLQEINELLKHIIEEEVTTTTEQETESESTTESTTKSTTESTAESIADSTTESISESTTESIAEATTESTSEPLTESTTEAVIDPEVSDDIEETTSDDSYREVINF